MAEQKNEALKTVFDAFDKDNSGFLDTAEVVQAAKELGVEFTEDEVKSVFTEVDKNFDGKITFAEFCAWWKLGKDNKMEKMVYMKMKALNLLKKARQAHTRYGTLLESKYGDKNQKNLHFGFSLGEPEEISTGSMKFRVNTDDVESMFEEFSAGLDGFSAENPTFCLRLRSENPDDAVGELEEKVEEVKMMLQQIPQIAMFLENVDISYGTDGDFVKMGVTCNIPQVLGMMQMMMQQFDMTVGTDNFTLDMEGKGDYSPGTILSGTVGDINPQFSAKIDGTLNGARATAMLHQIASGLAERKIAQQNFRNRHMEQMFSAVVGSLFSGAKMEIKLNKADKDSIIKASPMAGPMEQMQQAPVADMLQQFVPMATQMLGQAPPMVRGMIDMFYNNFSSQGGFCVHAPKACFQYNVKTEGFAKLYEIFFPQ